MTRACSIATITVVYNGAAILPSQLNALRRQTRKLDEIIVVNNASTDGSLSLLKTDFPEVTVLNQQNNVGVGGGLSAGLDYAVYQRNHAWIWLFDQDSLPADNCLEHLFEGLRFVEGDTEDVAILAPVCVNQTVQLGYSASVWRHGLRKPPVGSKHHQISFVDSVISSGTLVRREAVKDVGLPRSDFFMDFVDHEYCLRLRRHGYRIAVVAASQMEHAIGEPRRVSIFGSEKAWASHLPWREYYMTRNEVFTIWKYYPHWRAKSVVAQRLLRHALAVLLLGKEKLACLTMMYQGFADGRAGRLGIRSF
jgi:GT2 family glycosyltransferase